MTDKPIDQEDANKTSARDVVRAAKLARAAENAQKREQEDLARALVRAKINKEIQDEIYEFLRQKLKTLNQEHGGKAEFPHIIIVGVTGEGHTMSVSRIDFSCVQKEFLVGTVQAAAHQVICEHYEAAARRN